MLPVLRLVGAFLLRCNPTLDFWGRIHCVFARSKIVFSLSWLEYMSTEMVFCKMV